jgi:hypothetical protein
MMRSKNFTPAVMRLRWQIARARLGQVKLRGRADLTVRPHRRAKQSRVAQLFRLGSIPSAAELTRPTVDMAASRRAAEVN